eukprot:6204793-Pleurochrysis_carterae.AAC.1
MPPTQHLVAPTLQRLRLRRAGRDARIRRQPARRQREGRRIGGGVEVGEHGRWADESFDADRGARRRRESGGTGQGCQRAPQESGAALQSARPLSRCAHNLLVRDDHRNRGDGKTWALS